MQAYYTAPVARRLAVAHQLYREHGREMDANPAIRSGLAGIRIRAADLEEQMQAMDMGRTCSGCAARADGGCCSAMMADNTDAILLLINLLLAARPGWLEDNPAECPFLGRQGCTLAVKPIFCLNYNCSQIREAAGRGEMETLERLASRLLSAQTEVEKTILEWLGRQEAEEI